VLISAKKLVQRIGIDKAIAYTVFARCIQAFGGVGIVVFIARYLSKDEQGYYYTFGSIIAIQVFFELGLNSIITQYVAHEMAHLKWADHINTEGDSSYQSRLASLLHFVVKWFSFISLLLLIALIIAGNYFFTKFNNRLDVSWQMPWAILSLTTCGFLLIDPLFAFLEGLGKVKEVARMRLIQQTVYIVTVITLLFYHFKLYSSALAVLASFLTMLLLFLFSDNSKILFKLWKLKGEWKVNYRKEIFPYQWKIALSWMSGYFIFQLFNPVLFATEGAVIAGRMGMTIAALNGVLGLSMSWINTKVPLFSGLIAQKNYAELDKVFFKSFLQTIIITTLGLITLFAIVFVLQKEDLSIGNRFLSLLPLSFMCFSFLLNCLAFGMATYLRCHKSEPLLGQSVVFAIFSAISTVILGKYFGVIGITAGYLALGLTIGLPWIIVVFYRKRKLWHQIA